ncbi:MAG: NAD(P)-dependent glycerol-3-phosphate dehydrogenase [Candidatus Omnitrophica bacterium]|nr:NAD(P)-dependent glycerol-3-phosphate dehydrogenase [Candidatus Omnitrophota bacterium]
MEIAVFGDGGWGTTIAILLFRKGYDVTLWGAFPEYVDVLRKKGLNPKFLPGIEIPRGIRLISDAREISKNAMSVIAVPSQYLRSTLGRIKPAVGREVVSLTKGIENETLLRPSEVISEVLGPKMLAVLSGPTISFEVARNSPTTVVAASADNEFARKIQDIFITEEFRVYVSADMTGVELGGALKNVIAVASGISDGMGFGVNTKAAILTRGLVEIIRLGTKLGAEKDTFFGLSGLGDLATTCMSQHSRNRWLGAEIAKGKNLKDILASTDMTIEGVTTAKSAYDLSKKLGVEMPITQKIYEVLYGGTEPKKAVRELMTRSLKAEVI